MLTPAKNVEAKTTPKSNAAKSPNERMTLFIAYDSISWHRSTDKFMKTLFNTMH